MNVNKIERDRSSNSSVGTVSRLAGIDFMRGLAAFGVIVIHSGLVFHNKTAASSVVLGNLFAFAVPFFLVAAFYFAQRSRALSFRKWLTKRGGRLVIPYVAWSLLYFVLWIVKLVVSRQPVRVLLHLLDPISLFFSGGGGVALYFLPLLFIGLFVVQAIYGVVRRMSVVGIMIGLLCSWTLLAWTLKSGNGLSLAWIEGFHAACATLNHNFVFRLFFILLAEIIICVPHILAAQLGVRYLTSQNSKNGVILLAGLTLFITPLFLIAPISGHVRGVGAFILAWYLSGFIRETSFSDVVGACSFGIYLCHQVILEFIGLVINRFHWALMPVNAITILLVSGTAFLFSFFITVCASKLNNQIRAIFGVPRLRA